MRVEGGAATAAAFDVTDLDRAVERIAAVATDHGRLDGFINKWAHATAKAFSNSPCLKYAHKSKQISSGRCGCRVRRHA